MNAAEIDQITTHEGLLPWFLKPPLTASCLKPRKNRGFTPFEHFSLNTNYQKITLLKRHKLRGEKHMIFLYQKSISDTKFVYIFTSRDCLYGQDQDIENVFDHLYYS